LFSPVENAPSGCPVTACVCFNPIFDAGAHSRGTMKKVQHGEEALIKADLISVSSQAMDGLPNQAHKRLICKRRQNDAFA